MSRSVVKVLGFKASRGARILTPEVVIVLAFPSNVSRAEHSREIVYVNVWAFAPEGLVDR